MFSWVKGLLGRFRPPKSSSLTRHLRELDARFPAHDLEGRPVLVSEMLARLGEPLALQAREIVLQAEEEMFSAGNRDGSPYDIIRNIANIANVHLTKLSSDIYDGLSTIECAHRCAHCCNIPSRLQGKSADVLPVTIADGVQFLEYMEALSQAERKNILRLLAKAKRHADADMAWFKCPLLENKMCVSYESRPAVCKTFFSSDKDHCAAQPGARKGIGWSDGELTTELKLVGLIIPGIARSILSKRYPQITWGPYDMVTTFSNLAQFSVNGKAPQARALISTYLRL